MSKIFVDQVDPKTATTLTLGTSGDTVSIPSGVTLSTGSAIATASLGSGTASSSTFLRGDSTWATAGENNTPAFIAKYSGNGSGFANGTYVKLSFDSEVYDSGSTYDPTTNYRWTPGVAGKYQLYARIIFQAGGASPNQARIAIYKNGSVLQYSRWTTATTISDWTVQTSHMDIANTTDYYEAYAYQENASSSTTFTIGNSGLTNLFYGYRIIT